MESTGETGENTTDAILEVEKLDEGVKAEEEKQTPVEEENETLENNEETTEQ